MARPKHIVIDARNRRSSTGRYTDRLVENLQKIDKLNKYSILVEHDDPWKFKNKNFKPVYCDYPQFSFSPFDQFYFARLLYRLKPDLVHFTMPQQPLFFFGFRNPWRWMRNKFSLREVEQDVHKGTLSENRSKKTDLSPSASAELDAPHSSRQKRSSGCAIVTTTHDLTMLKHTRPSRFPAWLHQIGIGLYQFLFWFSHIKSKKVIVPSKFVAYELARRQPSTKSKIIVTYEAADPPIKLKSMAVKGAIKPFILHVGSPFPHKNLGILIEAFDEIKKTMPDLRLVLAGKVKGQFKKDLKRWVERSPNKADIVAPGFVNEPELKWLYENATAYVFPSLSEGFGLPGLEAMAHNCPVVASDSTCLPEIYGNGAEYFDPENLIDVTRAIEKVLISKKVRAELIKNGQNQLKKYSWAKMAAQTLKIYQNLLK